MIVKMKKLNIVGLKSEKTKVLDALRSSGCFELSSSSAVNVMEATSGEIDHSLCEEVRQALAVLEQAIDGNEKARIEFCQELKSNKKLSKKGKVERTKLQLPPSGKSLFAHKKEIDIESLSQIGEQKQQILSIANNIIVQKEQIGQINSTIDKNNKKCQKLLQYQNVDVPLSDIHDSKNIFMTLGILQKKSAQKIREAFVDNSDCTLRWFCGEKKEQIVFILAPIEGKSEIVELLKENGFVKCKLESTLAPKAEIEAINAQNRDLYNQKLQILSDIVSDADGLDKLKLYHDYIRLEIESQEAQAKIYETKKTFSIEGWVPSENANEIVQMIQEITLDVECEILEVDKEETPPTLTRSNALVSPYEAVTNMYSPPNPYEKDPNPFVGIFFFIFFGIMIGDAIYGLCLFAFTFVLMRCYKMDTGSKKLMMILCMGGVSAFIWGAIYNSWAAVGLPYNPILNPVENPFDFLIISLGLGYLQILFGFGLKLIANIRARDFVSMLADSGWKILIMLGGMLNFPSILAMFENQFTIIKMPSLPPIIPLVGLCMIMLGLVGMLITGGRHKRTISGKIVSGVGSWYDLVGLLSDVLSYCRLFGLALSGAIIGMVANILAKDVLFQIPIVGYGLGIAVAVFFHVFNLALACLGAYVHNSRLQFVEFFGKFYEGGGRSFSPMGHCTKYTKINQKLGKTR